MATFWHATCSPIGPSMDEPNCGHAEAAAGSHAGGPAPAPNTTRRRFLGTISAVAGAIAGVAVGIPIVGFLFEPLVRRPAEQWRLVGPVTDFRPGATVEVRFADAAPVPWAGGAAETAAWLSRSDSGEFVAYALSCTHLGCPIRWVEGARLFMCPCHGGVFYEDGSVAAGPPPRALDRYAVSVRNGGVYLRTHPLTLP
jgi:menaquinol-cytochrome c reductase iron-sulfur subunit